MSRSNSELDRLRSGRTELENHYIDELVSGNLSRRDFLRRGSTIGMSIPLLGAILAACGGGSSSSASSSGGASTASAPPTKGGTLRVASVTPAAAVNPLTIADAGGLTMLNQTGEFLIFDSNLKLALQPMLALSWTPNTRRQRVDVQAAPGRDVPQRRGDDRRRRRLDVPATLRPKKRLIRAVDVRRGAHAGGGQEGRCDRRSSSTSRRRTATSPTSSPRTTTTRSSSRRAPTTASGRPRSSALVRSSSGATPRTWARPSCPIPITGGRSRCSPRRASSSTRAKRRCFSRCRETMST